ncbi:hypothetical protein C8R46DRAFT_893471 [Mycena filopes]|nr:hypothetical protein C8R46DRAFT_893471 [Mycena filopes]
MEAITVVGHWNHKRGGGIWFPLRRIMLELIPGATVLIPSGTEPYSLVAVRAHEQQYVVRQFCDAGVLRWVEKGGRTDAQFEASASPVEVIAWEDMCDERGRASVRMFSHLRDIFVL